MPASNFEQAIEIVRQISQNLLLSAGNSSHLKPRLEQLQLLKTNLTPKEQNKLLIELSSPNQTESISIEGLTFPVRTVFKGIQFNQSLKLKDCTFLRDLLFSNCEFRSGLYLENINSSEPVLIENGSFHGANLEFNTFTGALKLRSLLGLTNLQVKGKSKIASFDGDGEVKLHGELAFSDTTFEQSIDPSLLKKLNPTKSLKFLDCTFESDLKINDIVFPELCSFEGTVFYRPVLFKKVQFNGLLDLSKTKLKSSFSIVDCQFNSGLIAEEMEANRDPKEEVECKFLMTGGSYAGNLQIKTKVFEFPFIVTGITFENCVSFCESNFSKIVSFENCFFRKELRFNNATLNSGLYFSITLTDNKIPLFRGTAAFGQLRSQNLELPNAIIDANVDLTYAKIENINLYNCTFLKEFTCDWAAVGSLNANDARFRNRTSFSGTVFKSAPRFHDADLFKDINFRNASFLDSRSEGAEGAYRTLKQIMSEHHNNMEEMNFSALELKCRRNGFKPKSWSITDMRRFFLSRSLFSGFGEFFFSWLYWLANGYGRSLFAPMCWLVYFLIVFAVYYSDPGIENANRIVQITNSQPTPGPHTWLDDIKHGSSHFILIDGRGFVFSFTNSLGPLRFLPSYNNFVGSTIWIQFFALIQSVLATVLWYLFFVGLKRRFKTLS